MTNLNPIAPKETQKERFEICIACPEISTGGFNFVASCNKCKCVLKAKVALNSSTCPLGKW